MRVYIVILNWNGWRETIEYLASVFRLEYAQFVAIVCDNGWGSSSLERYSAWPQSDTIRPGKDLRHARRFLSFSV
jgi:hypothetical protein